MGNRPAISYSADNIVLRKNGDEMELLVVERRYPPFQGEWALPGGFIEENESPVQASLRELEEETGLKLTEELAIPLSVRQFEERDPRGRVITYPFLFWLADQEVKVVAGDDAKQAVWVKLTELGPLAFDHGAILCEALGKFWPQMALFNPLLEQANLPSLFYKKKNSGSVYFGGSFNPWHQGHDQCLKQCSDAVESLDLVVVPDTNPWKDNVEVMGSRCFYQRYLEMARRLESTGYSIFSGFWGSETPNPTINWLPHTREERRGLLIGDDNFMQFAKWKDYGLLLRSLDFLYSVPRHFDLKDLEEQKKKLQVENDKLKIEVMYEHPYQELSSTEMRKNRADE